MKRFSGALYLTGAFMLAGSSVIAARFVTHLLGPFTVTAISLLIAVAGLLAACFRRIGGSLRGLRGKDWLSLLFQAVFGIFLFRLFLLLGLQRTSTAEAGILTGATPAATALMAALILKEPFNRAKALGLACTVTGILLLQGLLQPGSGFSAAHLVGNLLALLAALSESTFNIVSRVSSLRAGETQGRALDPIVQAMVVSAIALLLSLLPAALERPLPALAALGMESWLALVAYGLFCSALAYICWYAGIRRCQATTAAAFSGMMPLTALLLSVLLLGEQPHWQQWAGGLLVVGGMVLTGYRASRYALTPPADAADDMKSKVRQSL